MESDVWERFCDLALSLRGTLDVIHLNFSGGETFLYFDAFLDGLRHWLSLCDENGVRNRITVCTNGVLLDNERLEKCADLGLELTFSIDGPAAIHDAQRRDDRGRPTHERAVNNWRRYQELLETRNSRGACDIQSVIGNEGSLGEVTRFWNEQNLAVFNAIVAEPSKFTRYCTSTEWNETRRRYLDEFKALAAAKAETLGVPHFLSDYRGPYALYSLWNRMFLNRADHESCQPGTAVLAIDAGGFIYPCEGFLGYPSWSIGDVWTGICDEKRRRFLDELNQVRSGCGACGVREYCDGGCVAAAPERGLVLNSEGGCEFIGELINSVKSSYCRLGQHHD